MVTDDDDGSIGLWYFLYEEVLFGIYDKTWLILMNKT
jgi:hypothetical protein